MSKNTKQSEIPDPESDFHGALDAIASRVLQEQSAIDALPPKLAARVRLVKALELLLSGLYRNYPPVLLNLQAARVARNLGHWSEVQEWPDARA
jgi:hypothetical protein